MTRRMNASNSGTVNAVSPWAGLNSMPLVIKLLRVGATLDTLTVSASAIGRRCSAATYSNHATIQTWLMIRLMMDSQELLW